jgi:hypothetical protein
MVQEFHDRGNLGALLIQEPEGQQRITGRLDPPDPGHRQPRNIPDRRAALWHLDLPEPPYFDDTP